MYIRRKKKGTMNKTILSPVLEEWEQNLAPSLIGKILSTRTLSLNVVQLILKATWGAVTKFLLEEVDTNLSFFILSEILIGRWF